MKKIFLNFIVLSLIFTTSCSNESSKQEENVIPKNTNSYAKENKSIDVYKDMYKEILNSVDYTSYQNAVNLFDLNLHKEGVYPKFKDSIELFNWIKENINKTGFNTYESAVEQFNEMNLKYTIILNKNSDFYKSVSSLTTEEQVDIFLTQNLLNYNQIVNKYNYVGPCENGCINDAVACQNAADSAYAQSMALSGVIFAMGNPISAAIVAWNAHNTHNAAIHACAVAFNECIEAC